MKIQILNITAWLLLLFLQVVIVLLLIVQQKEQQEIQASLAQWQSVYREQLAAIQGIDDSFGRFEGLLNDRLNRSSLLYEKALHTRLQKRYVGMYIVRRLLLFKVILLFAVRCVPAPHTEPQTLPVLALYLIQLEEYRNKDCLIAGFSQTVSSSGILICIRNYGDHCRGDLLAGSLTRTAICDFGSDDPSLTDCPAGLYRQNFMFSGIGSW